jgi:uncharacterized membrane protein
MSTQPGLRKRRHTLRLPLAISLSYLFLVLIALASTLRSLYTDSFDGLNNWPQIPLALPWWLIVPYPGSHIADAWLAAAMGGLNALILFMALAWILRRNKRGNRT